ncbi:GNAT family N-acetyltransferase [Luteolibacter sp. GHJ8]|uniref:GNAT family N-acetyltransferase n=1 Tax=Luteolibacter rhizosphaerae TaxID=2989719 RepID=A0ABT3G7P6_9BACT|nr:GNAT family N-acetyltransferase [Luteolibacter rhizosphaerae]MCW1915873.1 GNAT family N-acetyltransferase [Luteolibacter rhizosphaerae]
MPAPPLPPPPPQALHSGPLALRFAKAVVPVGKHLAPYYHFRILSALKDVGHINLRVGDSEHIRRVVGHVGFGIRKRCRGHGFALLACQALAPFAHTIGSPLVLTCDPENHASRRTLERLTGNQGEEISVPPGDPHLKRGSRIKLRFHWHPALMADG